MKILAPSPMSSRTLGLGLMAFAACTIDSRDVEPLSERDDASSSVPAQGGSGSPAGLPSGGSGTGAPPGSGGGGSPGVSGTGGTASEAVAATAMAGAATIAAGAGGSAGGVAGDEPGECASGAPGCTGAGPLITPVDGWVAAETNGVGIQGSFFTSSDLLNGGNSTVAPSTFGASGADICVSGSVGPIAALPGGDFDYANYWGSIVGLNLSSDPETGALGAWSSETPSGRALGFTFTLLGPSVPFDAPLRFSAQDTAGNLYCVESLQPGAGRHTVLFSNLTRECWIPNGIALPSSPSLSSLQWVVNSNTAAAQPYDFCIAELAVLLE